MNFLQALLSTPALQFALFAALLASLAAGMIGSYVVTKRIVAISGSIAHSVLGGMGAALWLNRTQGWTWLSPTLGAVVASLISALIIGWVHLRYREREDALIAMIWSVGMAIGVIFVSKTPGSNVELTHFLLGNILWVTPADLGLLAILDVVIIVLVSLLHSHFLAICFDEKQARLRGLRVQGLYLLLLMLIALSVVMLIRVVGIILVLSMLALPASIASSFTRKLTTTMVVAFLLNVAFSTGGLALAYRLDWPAGATIALFSGLIYLIALRFRQQVRS